MEIMIFAAADLPQSGVNRIDILSNGQVDTDAEKQMGQIIYICASRSTLVNSNGVLNKRK